MNAIIIALLKGLNKLLSLLPQKARVSQVREVEVVPAVTPEPEPRPPAPEPEFKAPKSVQEFMKLTVPRHKRDLDLVNYLKRTGKI